MKYLIHSVEGRIIGYPRIRIAVDVFNVSVMSQLDKYI